jgi:signal peptidase II
MEQTTTHHQEAHGTPSGRPGGSGRGLARGAVFLLTALGAVAADLSTKAIATASLQRHRPVEVVGEWVRLTLGYNEGVAFGLFATDGPGVVLLSGAVLAALAVWAARALRDPGSPRGTALTLGLVLGGGVANLIDRVGDGRVTDFLDLGLGAHRWPTFNLADVAIVVGVALLMLWSYRNSSADGASAPPPSP